MNTLNCFCVGQAITCTDGLYVKMHRVFLTFVEAMNWAKRHGLKIWREERAQVTLYLGY